jgi:spectinomycin phosphotransferase
MREPPDLRIDGLSASLRVHYGLRVVSVTFLPVGQDPNAAVYRVVTRDGSEYFLKVRFGAIDEPGLFVPRALEDLGISNVVAPLRTLTSELWCPLDGYDDHRIVHYPFVDGGSAMTAGLNDEQWRKFGSVLRDVHSSGLELRFRGRLPVETFSLPAAALVR